MAKDNNSIINPDSFISLVATADCCLSILDCYHSPPLNRLIVIFGLLLITGIPAIARTSCSELREEKGEAAYEKCRIDEKEDEIKENIKKHKESLEDTRADIEDHYEDLIDRIEDRKKDRDRSLERKEDDEKDRLDDMKDDDDDEEDIAKQKGELSDVKSERKAAKKYYDAWINTLEAQQDLDEARLDLEAAQYEYLQRGGSTDWIRWY